MIWQPQWRVYHPKWPAPYVGWRLGRADCSFWPDQFGRVRSVGYTLCLPPEGLLKVLKEEVVPAARVAVPPVKGRYPYPGSTHRNEYLEAIVRELNARKLFPLRP